MAHILAIDDDEAMLALIKNTLKKDGHDVTCIPKITERLKEQQKKRQFTALAHDIKTPLAIVTGNAELLSETEQSGEQREYIAFILDYARQIHRYVTDMLELSIQDEGSGFSKEALTLAASEFYRADPGRSSKEHFGMGLSIASRIAGGLNGTLRLENAPEKGALVTVSLPVCRLHDSSLRPVAASK